MYDFDSWLRRSDDGEPDRCGCGRVAMPGSRLCEECYWRYADDCCDGRKNELDPRS